jgi:uncharacterized protein DUF4136
VGTQNFRSFALMLVTLASAPLYAQKVTYDWDKDVAFSSYRTYKWAEVTGGKASNQLTHERIISGVNGQLQAKGLNLTTDDQADLYVTYQVITDKSGQVASFNPDGQWKPGLGLNGDASKPPAGTPRKGALIVDLYDRKMKKLIWRGTVTAAFDSREAVNYKIGKGLSKLFSYFPPPPGK